MKRYNTRIVLAVLIIILLSGCSNNENASKELSLSVGGKNISYHIIEDVNINNLNDLFSFAFDTHSIYSIEEVDIGDKIYIDFGANPPDKFYIRDYLLTREGKQQYNEKLALDVPVQGDNDRYCIIIDMHMASYLSSYYEEDKKDNRGFLIVTTTEGVEKTYQFVIRTKAA